MSATDQYPTSPERDRNKQSSDSAAHAASLRAVPIGDRFVFEINAKTGMVSKCEVIDLVGVRRELSEEEQANLAKTRMQDRLEGLLERAFESGIASAFGGDGEQADRPEDEEDSELRQVLLDPLLKKSIVRHLMRRNVLAPAILRTLIQYSIKAASADNGESHSHGG